MLKRVKRFVAITLAAGLYLSTHAQTAAVPNGWHLKDKTTDGYYGISLDKAYDFLKGKKSTPVIVAVIDSGIDTLHEDLKPVLWTNTKEKPGNGIDDDGNGYVDDVHGWNFLGGRDGRNVKEDSYEAARVYHKYKDKFSGAADTTAFSEEDQELYRTWKRAEKDVVKGVDMNEVFFLKKMYPNFKSGDSVIAKDLNKTEYNGKDLESYTPSSKSAEIAKNIILSISKANNSFDITNVQLLDELEGQLRKADAADAAPKDYRSEIVKDNYNDINDRFYGNNDLMAGTPFHGTHVAGIIGAKRNNGKGIDGIADNVKIMMLRAVPDGDEHDKDIALAIRYAADNGAKVINMSFGKSFSPEKQWVDDAVKYAAGKGVLLVHAAGNSAENVDSAYNFPNPVFINDTARATNWITVGASGDPKNGGLVANFSNYGKREVDVFAPGVQIYSTIPGGNSYGNAQGTSMASPVVAGLAAFVLSYYPNLTPQQVKQVIEQSASKVADTVKNPGTGEAVALSKLSVTGGLVNAYEAVKLAATLSGKAPQPVKTKSVVRKMKSA
jgi:subtilisin family serine protease